MRGEVHTGLEVFGRDAPPLPKSALPCRAATDAKTEGAVSAVSTTMHLELEDCTLLPLLSGTVLSLLERDAAQVPPTSTGCTCSPQTHIDANTRTGGQHARSGA